MWLSIQFKLYVYVSFPKTDYALFKINFVMEKSNLLRPASTFAEVCKSFANKFEIFENKNICDRFKQFFLDELVICGTDDNYSFGGALDA